MRGLRLILTGCLCLLGSGDALLASGGQQTKDLLARHHYAGATAVNATDDAATAREVARMEETRAFMNHLVERNLPRILQSVSGGAEKGHADAVGPLRPLLDDLFQAESMSEWRARPDGATEFALAIHLPDHRAELWEANLKALAGQSRRIRPLRMDEFRGWEVTSDRQSFRFARAGDWVVIGAGRGSLELQNNFVGRIRDAQRPIARTADYWLQSEVNWPLLQSRFRFTTFLKPALTEMTVIGRGEYLRTEIRATYPEPLDWEFKRWQIPTNVVREPLISFLAGQNLGAVTQPPKRLEQLAVQPLAGQLFLWAQAAVPFQTFGAIPVEKASELLADLSTNLPALFDEPLKERGAGQIEWSQQRQEISWKGLPIIVPYLRAMSGPGGEILLAGLFPLAPGGQPPPDELIEQVAGRDDVMFYHWEITEARLAQWRMVSQLLPMLPTSLPGQDPRAIRRVPEPTGQKWLSAVAPKLGNTITEVTVSAPDELLLVRRSHIGFGALELVLLVNQLGGYEEAARPSPRPRDPAAHQSPAGPAPAPIPGNRPGPDKSRD